MSDYICFELQIEIIKRLPLKSLVKFKAVSKQWKSLIDSSEFTAVNTDNHEPLLLISYMHGPFSTKYISLLDGNFCQHKFSTTPLYTSLDEIVGCSHGLFCIYNFPGPDTAVLWNPLIRKTVTIDVPKENNYVYGTTVGFGVCPITLDPLIVKITRFRKLSVDEYGSWRWEISVFTLSSRNWQTLCFNLPRNNIEFTGNCVDIDGFIYWCAYKRITTNFQHGLYKDINLIMSFDMTSHEFNEIYLPDSLANKNRLNLSISKRKESVVVLNYYEAVAKSRVCDVWMMSMDDHHDVQNSFTKLYTIKPTDSTSVKEVLGFTNNGTPIIEKQNDDGVDFSTVAVYETDSQVTTDA